MLNAQMLKSSFSGKPRQGISSTWGLALQDHGGAWTCASCTSQAWVDATGGASVFPDKALQSYFLQVTGTTSQDDSGKLVQLGSLARPLPTEASNESHKRLPSSPNRS